MHFSADLAAKNIGNSAVFEEENVIFYRFSAAKTTLMYVQNVFISSQKRKITFKKFQILSRFSLFLIEIDAKKSAKSSRVYHTVRGNKNTTGFVFN